MQKYIVLIALLSASCGAASIDTFGVKLDSPIPKAVDWRNVTHRVTPVKNGGKYCNSSWAFVVAGMLEGQLYNLGMELTSLSSQHLVDCSLKNDGCFGGTIEEALDFVIQQGGLQDDKSYSARPNEQKCRADKSKLVPIPVKSYARVASGDVGKLKEVVARYGPVATYMDASNQTFFEADFRTGVYVNPNCKSNRGSLNYPILIVGYGEDKEKGDYWIVKNSLSWFNWGNNGYLRISSKDNHCGLATSPIVALF